MFRTTLLIASLLVATTACEPEADAPIDLQSASALHYDDDGAPLYRVEATFIGAERHADVDVLLNTLTIEPGDASPAEVAERTDEATQRLAREGGEAVLIEVHPLQAEDQGRSFGYTVATHGRVEPQPEAQAHGVDGLATSEQALRLSPGGIRVHDLWCYVFRVRYRTNSGQGFYSVSGPLGFIPLPIPPNGHWMDIAFSMPSPWPYPWFAMVQNPYSVTLDYDMRVSCWM